MRELSEHPVRRSYRWLLAIAGTLLAVAVILLVYARSGPDYVRGAWLTGYGTGYMTPAEVDRTIAAAKAAGLNTLFVEVRKAADAYYRPGVEPLASGVARGLDPLGYLLQRAHRQGIKVHAWVSVFRVWRGESRPTDPEHLANRHHEWLTASFSGNRRSSDGLSVDPGVPDAVAYTVRVVGDVVRRYDVDGLHLDFIRYPDSQSGYAPSAISRYMREAGGRTRPDPSDRSWQRWRREQVTSAVRAISSEARRVRPGLLITAAAIAYGDCPSRLSQTYGYQWLGQDWQTWLSMGLIDAVLPMDYRDTRDPIKLQQFRQWLPAFRRWSGGKPVFVGLAAYASDSESIAEQIEDVRRAGLDGFAVFCFNESGIRVTESRQDLVRSISGTRSCWRKWRASAREFVSTR